LSRESINARQIRAFGLGCHREDKKDEGDQSRPHGVYFLEIIL
jgi:murein L,D-transpeptidase YafK